VAFILSIIFLFTQNEICQKKNTLSPTKLLFQQ